MLMNRHPSITCDGEIFPSQPGSKGLCACSKSQVDCEYYKTVAEHMLENNGTQWNGELFTRHPQYADSHKLQRALTVGWSLGAGVNRVRTAMLPRAMKRKAQTFVDAHLLFMANSLEFHGSSVYLDGTKDWRRAELFASDDRINFKAIHLVRDGRGFCNSYIKNGKLEKKFLPKAAKVWMQHIHEWDIFRKMFPDVEYLSVRYEDICNSYTETINKVCTFLDVTTDVDLLNEACGQSHVIGNRMRMEFQGSIREDRSWEEMLTNDEIHQITKLMRDGLKRFDYLDQ